MKKFIKKLFKLDKEEQRRTSNLNPVYVARKIDIENMDLTPLENSINEVSTKLDTFIGEIAQEQITQNNKISTIEQEQQTQNTNITANTNKIKNHNTTNNTQNTRLDAIDKINNDQNVEIGRIEGKFDSQISDLTTKVENNDAAKLEQRITNLEIYEISRRSIEVPSFPVSEALQHKDYVIKYSDITPGAVIQPPKLNAIVGAILYDNNGYNIYLATRIYISNFGGNIQLEIFFRGNPDKAPHIVRIEYLTRTSKL